MIMELWDVYDDNRNKTGKTHMRGRRMACGENHVVIGVILYNSEGEILITRRSPEKRSDPGKWENTAGCVQAGESSHQGALRELREETGIDLGPSELAYLCSRTVSNCFVDIYIAKIETDIKDLVFQPGETCGARWISFEDWEELLCSKDVVFAVKNDFEDFAETVSRYIAASTGENPA